MVPDALLSTAFEIELSYSDSAVLGLTDLLCLCVAVYRILPVLSKNLNIISELVISATPKPPVAAANFEIAPDVMPRDNVPSGLPAAPMLHTKGINICDLFIISLRIIYRYRYSYILVVCILI